MLNESLEPFFNVNEFAVTVSIKNTWVNGVWEPLLSTVNQVQCIQFKFTCAQGAIPKVKLDDEIKMDDQYYRIVDIKPDGTGLVTLLLETMQ